MATQTVQNTRISLLFYTTQQITTTYADTVLLAGEMLINSDTNEIYIGDGDTALSALEPIQGSLVKYTDIVNNLTTTSTDKPLSAAQGKALKDLIDDISAGQLTVPVATAEDVGGIKSGGDITVSGEGAVTVNSAAKLKTARTIDLSGDVTGSATFDGSANVTITATVADDSHNHTIANIDNLQTTLDTKAPLVSPALTGTPTAPTATAGTNTTQIATTAFVKAAIDSHIASAQALEFKGVATPETAEPESPGVGDVYIAEEAGTIFGQSCEVGDMLIYSGDKWYVVQANLNGAVTGPTSAVTDRIAVFNGATGKVIKDGGYTIAQLRALASASADGLMSSEDFNKLAGIANGAEVNQNAVTTIATQSGNATATAKTDTITINGAGGVTTSASGKTITITGTTYANATTSADGLMSSEDKKKLDGVAAGAEVNVQSDWNVSEDTSDAFIKNKPTALKNPTSLTVNLNGTNTAYDGSAAKTVTINASTVGAVAKVSGTQGHVVEFGANGAIADSGLVADNILQSTDTLILNCSL